MTDFLLTLAVGLVFGFIVFKLKVQGGMMVGAIVGVATLNIVFGSAYMPSFAKTTAQIAAGAFIGCTVEKSDLKRMRHLIKPAAVLLTGMLIQNLVVGFVIYAISPLDLVTSLMCGVPGGLTDIPIISADMGADVPKVAVLHFIRMVTGVGVFPTLIAMIDRRERRIHAVEEPSHEESPIKRITGVRSTRVFLMTVVVATAFGLIGFFLDIPAGVILFSMIGVICLKLAVNRAYMPLWAKRATQALSGAYIGSNVGYKDVLELRFLILPAIFLILFLFTTCYIVGHLLHKRFGMNLIVSMLAATPAGASDMTLISSDLGVSSADLIMLQIIRLIVVVSIFPQIINLIVHIASRTG